MRILFRNWTKQDSKYITILLFVMLSVFYAGTHDMRVALHMQPAMPPASAYLAKVAPRTPASAYQAVQNGPFEVAKVLGRSRGCQDVKADFIMDVNDAAVHAGLDPRIFASTIANESGCNQFAISSRGAIGLTQVVPQFHSKEYDFNQVNLFNRKENLRVGAEIEAGYIRQHGTAGGVTAYQGMAKGCDSCDDNYASKVLGLAGKVSVTQ
jgi:hypothetical protein